MSKRLEKNDLLKLLENEVCCALKEIDSTKNVIQGLKSVAVSWQDDKVIKDFTARVKAFRKLLKKESFLI